MQVQSSPGGENHTEVRLRCPVCLAVYRTGFDCCPADGGVLSAWEGDPLLGAELAGRYVIEELVGQGAMGLIYRARHVCLPRQFAIKILFGDLVVDPRMRIRFAQEAALASRLSHPNVVPVVDFGRSDTGLLYLVMDFVEGEVLAEMIAREAPLEPERAVRLIRQLARGLGHAHRRGLVHRDFKPGNVLLEPDEGGATVPRILDFGLAISTRDRDEQPGRLTEFGVIIGTPIYIAPEQVLDLAVDHRADLFALGVVLYEMLAGRPPFDGRPVEIAHKNVIYPVPAIAQRSPGIEVPPALEKVVRRLLEKAPEDRYGSADELCEALDAIEAGADRPGRRARSMMAQAVPGDLEAAVEASAEAEVAEVAAVTDVTKVAAAPGAARRSSRSHRAVRAASPRPAPTVTRMGAATRAPQTLEQARAAARASAAAGQTAAAQMVTVIALPPRAMLAPGLDSLTGTELIARHGVIDGGLSRLRAATPVRRRRLAVAVALVFAGAVGVYAAAARRGAGGAVKPAPARAEVESTAPSRPSGGEPELAPGGAVASSLSIPSSAGRDGSVREAPLSNQARSAQPAPRDPHALTVFVRKAAGAELAAGAAQAAATPGTVRVAATRPGTAARPGSAAADPAASVRAQVEAAQRRAADGIEGSTGAGFEGGAGNRAGIAGSAGAGPTGAASTVAGSIGSGSGVGSAARSGGALASGAPSTGVTAAPGVERPSLPAAVVPGPSGALAGARITAPARSSDALAPVARRSSRPRSPIAVPGSRAHRESGAVPPIHFPRWEQAPGQISARMCIDTRGAVTSVSVLSPVSRGVRATVERAAAAWRYRPIVDGDEAVPACFATTFRVQVE